MVQPLSYFQYTRSTRCSSKSLRRHTVYRVAMAAVFFFSTVPSWTTQMQSKFGVQVRVARQLCFMCPRRCSAASRRLSAFSASPAFPTHATIACLRTCAARRRVQRVGGRRIRRRPIRHDGVVLALACRCRRQPRSRVRVPINPRLARLQPAHATLRRCRHCPSRTRRLPQRRDRLGVG